MTNFLQRILITLFFLGIFKPAFANDFTGKDLAKFCQSPDKNFSAGICSGLIIGFDQGFSTGLDVLNEKTSYCPPETVSVEHMKKAVIKYLKENPKKSYEHYGLLIIQALNQEFPCKEKISSAR